MYWDQWRGNTRSLSDLPTIYEPRLARSLALQRTGTPSLSRPQRRSNSSVTGDSARKHLDHLPRKPSDRSRSPGRYPPTRTRPHPNPVKSFHELPNRHLTGATPSLFPIHCREWQPHPGSACKPVRTSAACQNASTLERPTFPLSTSGFPLPAEHPRSCQYYSTPRYNSAPCYTLPSTCLPVPSPPCCSCKRTCSKPSGRCSRTTANNAWKSRLPTRKKATSRKEKWMPSYYRYRSPRCKIHLSWRTTVPRIACLSAARPENQHTRQSLPELTRTKLYFVISYYSQHLKIKR